MRGIASPAIAPWEHGIDVERMRKPSGFRMPCFLVVLLRRLTAHGSDTLHNSVLTTRW